MAKFYAVSPSNAQKVDGSNSSTDFSRFGQEVLTSSSNLAGHAIGQVDVWVSRSNTSVSGTAFCRIRKGSDDSIAYEVGSLDVSTIVQSGNFPSNPTTFGNASTSTNTYTLVAGDKVLIEYSGGSSSNYLRCGDSGSGNTPYESGTNSRSVEYWTSKGYYLQNNPRDFAANFWDATGGGAPPSPPPPTPPSPSPPPPPPTVGYATNTAKDIAGIFWAIGTGTPPPPPPPPPGVPPGPPPQGLTEFYSVVNSSSSGRFLTSTGQAGSSQGFIRVGEKCNSRSSQLIGKVVHQVDVQMEKVGSPKGILTVNIRKGSDDSVGATIGTLDVSTMQSQYTYYEFINQSNVYALQPFDKVSVEYNDTSSNSKNYIGVNENNNDPFDGQNTCSAYFTVAMVYNTNTSKDLCLNLWT